MERMMEGLWLLFWALCIFSLLSAHREPELVGAGHNRRTRTLSLGRQDEPPPFTSHPGFAASRLTIEFEESRNQDTPNRMLGRGRLLSISQQRVGWA
ncbi:hypothetical protein GQ53DRAFT_755868 [Thozetella sp. PMI_491]|nr:hypothetical protein GQ53DRAFT_755868 [Thozetella sp. PMI_491]